MPFKTINCALCRLVIALFVSCSVSVAKSESTDSSFFSNFANAELIDQDNKSFSFAEHQGKLMLVNFVFTNCATVCPVQSFQLSQLKNTLSPSTLDGVVFVSVSLDPVRDTPKVLKHFIRHQKIDDANWYFLTGIPDVIAAISDRLKLFDGHIGIESVPSSLDHDTAIWLVNRHGQVVMRYNGAPIDITRVAREVEQLNRLDVI